MVAAKHQEILLPEEIISRADEEIQSAVELEETLLGKVREGDESVDFEQVEKARGMRRFAELRREAAERKASALRERLEAAEFEQALKAGLEEFKAASVDVGPILDEAAAVMRRAEGVIRRRNEAVIRLAELAPTAGFEDRLDEPELVGDVPRSTSGPFYAGAWFRAGDVEGDITPRGSLMERLQERLE